MVSNFITFLCFIVYSLIKDVMVVMKICEMIKHFQKTLLVCGKSFKNHSKSKFQKDTVQFLTGES